MHYIKIKDSLKTLIETRFSQFLKENKFQEAKLSFDVNLKSMIPTDIEKPTVLFTADAYLKIKALVNNSAGEIGWHGTVAREGAKFTIKDILVYPQYVSASTTSAIEPDYQLWLMNQPDPIFDNLRFQGHSHVNFGVTPSGVDTNFYEKILMQLQDNDYFIFLIINKRSEMNIWIYDFSQNMIFEKEDITVNVINPDGLIISEWCATETAKYIKDPVKEIQTQTLTTELPPKAISYYEKDIRTTQATPKKDKVMSATQIRKMHREELDYYAKWRGVY